MRAAEINSGCAATTNTTPEHFDCEDKSDEPARTTPRSLLNTAGRLRACVSKWAKLNPRSSRKQRARLATSGAQGSLRLEEAYGLLAARNLPADRLPACAGGGGRRANHGPP